eukprot:6072502-Lingulodinium_polyedra.AAC.1
MGGITSPAGSFLPEIKNRVASARHAYVELKHKTLAAGALTRSLKLQLVSSLVDSRLFYGASTWPLLKPQELQPIYTLRTQ